MHCTSRTVSDVGKNHHICLSSETASRVWSIFFIEQVITFISYSLPKVLQYIIVITEPNTRAYETRFLRLFRAIVKTNFLRAGSPSRCGTLMRKSERKRSPNSRKDRKQATTTSSRRTCCIPSSSATTPSDVTEDLDYETAAVKVLSKVASNFLKTAGCTQTPQILRKGRRVAVLP